MLNKNFFKFFCKKKDYLLLLLLLSLFNRFSLRYLLGSYIENLILISNLVIFFIIFFFIILKYFSFVKKKNKISFLIFFLFFFISVDIFFSLVMYSQKEDELLRRHPSPYDMFRGKPNKRFKYINNSYGFRGDEIKYVEDKKLIIGFFAGSAGYNGQPPIINIVSQLLESEGVPNRVYNFSSTSSHHPQHLHRLIEFMEYPFDIIIFYGGGNETEGYYYYDPRPNYPYNFYYKNELNSFSRIILENSFFFYELDKLTGWISRRNILNKEKEKNFDIWIQKIIKNYFLVLGKAQNISNNSIKPNVCSKTNFFAFFQPLNPQEKKVYYMQEQIVKSDLKREINNFYDLTFIKNKLNFTDSIHIDNQSNHIVAKEIYDLIKTAVSSCKTSFN